MFSLLILNYKYLHETVFKSKILLKTQDFYEELNTVFDIKWLNYLQIK